MTISIKIFLQNVVKHKIIQKNNKIVTEQKVIYNSMMVSKQINYC